jgi:CO/xanthine dehydrogenase FAD-binding subunit
VIGGSTGIAWKIQRDRDVRKRGNLKVHGVADRYRSRGNREGFAPSELENAIRTVNDLSTGLGCCQVGGADFERLRVQHVRQLHAHAASAQAAAVSEPTDDANGSAEYKAHLVEVLVARAFREAALAA